MPCSWIERNQCCENDYTNESNLKIQFIPIKQPMTFFKELGLIILQFIWGEKRPRRSKAVVERNVELEESTFLTSDYTTKTLWYRHKNRNIEQWNKTQSWEINPHSYLHLFFDKGGKNVQWRKDREESLFSKWCWETGQPHVKEWNWNTSSHYTQK